MAMVREDLARPQTQIGHILITSVAIIVLVRRLIGILFRAESIPQRQGLFYLDLSALGLAACALLVRFSRDDELEEARAYAEAAGDEPRDGSLATRCDLSRPPATPTPPPPCGAAMASGTATRDKRWPGCKAP